MHKLYTYGYGGRSFTDLLNTLYSLEAILVDTRFAPVSRIPQWNKKFLLEKLGSRHYHHLTELGNVNYKNGGPIKIQDLPAGLAKLNHFLRISPVILLCGCTDLAFCHRLVIAQEAEKVIGAKVEHLGVNSPSAPAVQVAVQSSLLVASTPLLPAQIALSIRQPWAWLIAQGIKDIENRSWSTHYRGLFLIHAGLKFDQAGYEGVGLKHPHLSLPAQASFEKGGIVGVAELMDCVTEHPSPWFEGGGLYGFVLANARPVEFVSWPGQLGFFKVEM